MPEPGSRQVHSGTVAAAPARKDLTPGCPSLGPPALWDRDEEDTAGTGRDRWQENGSGSGAEAPPSIILKGGSQGAARGRPVINDLLIPPLCRGPGAPAPWGRAGTVQPRDGAWGAADGGQGPTQHLHAVTGGENRLLTNRPSQSRASAWSRAVSPLRPRRQVPRRQEPRPAGRRLLEILLRPAGGSRPSIIPSGPRPSPGAAAHSLRRPVLTGC